MIGKHMTGQFKTGQNIMLQHRSEENIGRPEGIGRQSATVEYSTEEKMMLEHRAEQGNTVKRRREDDARAQGRTGQYSNTAQHRREDDARAQGRTGQYSKAQKRR
jgi:hypothetical protein